LAGKGKGCGIDALIIKGRSDSPQVLRICEDGVQFDDGSGLWGQDIEQCTHFLINRYGKDTGALMIGPAGENGVLFSTISTGDLRTFGRGGLGAVMGSKKVKAIVFEGRRRTEVYDNEQLQYVCKQARRLIEANPITSKGLKAFGTPILMNIINGMGMFPNYNYQHSQTDKASLVSGEKITETMFERRRACQACYIACDRITNFNGIISRGPEYETVWALGPNCGIFDLGSIALSNYLCNKLGMDTISCGSTIACAMELNQRGLIENIVEFGQKDLSDVLNSIAHRRGFGDKLANGSKRLSEEYGEPELSMQVKGLEMPAYDPRGAQGMGLTYAVSNRGACHLRSYILSSEILGIPKLLDRDLTKEKVSLEVVLENLNAAVDCLILCRFTGFALSEEYYARMLSAVTGVDYTENEFISIGEKIWNIERIYNNRAGFTKEDDRLPKRLLEEPIREGPAKGKVCRLEEMLPLYYKARGWDSDGVPTDQKIRDLGIEDV
jgi:aldehyde:ferredoxin oxidoreductase